MKSIKYMLTGACFLLLMPVSCVDANLEEVLDYTDHYQTSADADNAILGLYGSFMNLAGQVVVLNELRADLMDVTVNASRDLQEINRSNPSVGNTYADPVPFYTVIMNCNDILFNLDKMLKENRLTQDEYTERYSDVAALRCWVYLQLGIHFGEISYVTDPMVTINDVLQAEKQPVIPFNELIDKLVECMETLPTLEAYVNSPLAKYQLDGYNLNYFFINKRLLMGDLYLWQGKYQEAATQYSRILATNDDASDAVNHKTYKCRTWVWNASSEPTFQIVYYRYKWDDIRSYRNNWYTMFELPAENREAATELIWTLSYDKSFAPEYPFISLFANEGRGTYQLKPSQYAIDELWEAQVQTNGFVFDGRGRNSSFKKVNGEYVVQKYLYTYSAEKPFEQSGKWFLYRAGLLHLRYAEAANRAGYPKLAYALVNQGIKNVYNWKGALAEQQSQTGWGPGNYYPEPFYLDARYGDQPYYRRPWRDNNGIRGRACLKSVEFPESITTLKDSIQFMEKVIIQEAALECGFEGNRWGDLLRVARRMDKEGGDGSAYLTDNLHRKYELSGIAMPDLSSKEKWYLPFRK